jgi:hypothetical protein
VTIIDWNGADLPAELRNLPAGRYVIQPADEALTPDAEQPSSGSAFALR